MGQTPAVSIQRGGSLDYTPASDVSLGDVVLIGSIPMVADHDIKAGAVGAFVDEGVFEFAKDNSTFADGDSAYWNATASPVVGDASSGAITSTASGAYLAGLVLPGTTSGLISGALTGDATVRVKLTAARRTTTLAGSLTADDITGSDASLGISGKAGSAGAGGSVPIVGGAGNGSGNAGGLVSLTGGAAGSGNAAGGAASMVGGVGAGSSAGGVAAVTGGASAASSSGNGGAASLKGGAVGASGTGVGGAVAIAGGAGASGATAGAVVIDAGAANSGTASYVALCDVNGATTYLNRGPLKALQVGLTLTALGTNQSSAPTSAQLLGGLLSQTGATGAGVVTLPTGTALSTACARTPVVGDTFDCYFYNLGGSQTLTITGQTGTTVVGTAAVGTGKMAQMKFYNTGSNAWNVYCIVSA